MKPVLLFAHGAGAGSSHPWMVGWAERLSAEWPVRSFDYPYMKAGKRAPNRAPVLIEAHRAELSALRRAYPDRPVVLIGKSMGSRMGCHLALEEPVAGVVCMGYPLVSPGKSKAMRDQVLYDLDVPVLFVQGTRDRLCPLDTLAEVRPRMKARSELHVVEAGDHSLKVTKTWCKQTGLSQDDADEASFEAIRRFIASLG